MFSLVKAALGGAWGYIATAVAALAAVLVVLFQAKKAGQNEVIAESAKKEVENVKTAHEVEREVATAKPVDVRKRLFDRFSRD